MLPPNQIILDTKRCCLLLFQRTMQLSPTSLAFSGSWLVSHRQVNLGTLGTLLFCRLTWIICMFEEDGVSFLFSGGR